MAPEVFDRLVALLTETKAKFRVIEHAAEGKSEAISIIRGNRPDQAAKAMVLDVRGGGGGRRHVLAILPGSRKLDFAAVATLFEARKCGFASPETAQELTGCVMGAVPPFALNPELAIVVEQDLLANESLFFNAGRLDRSMELDTRDWLAVAKPRVARIASLALKLALRPGRRGRLRAAAGNAHRCHARTSGTRLSLQAFARQANLP